MLLGGCYGVAMVLGGFNGICLGVAMVWVWRCKCVAMVLLGGCYGVARGC